MLNYDPRNDLNSHFGAPLIVQKGFFRKNEETMENQKLQEDLEELRQVHVLALRKIDALLDKVRSTDLRQKPSILKIEKTTSSNRQRQTVTYQYFPLRDEIVETSHGKKDLNARLTKKDFLSCVEFFATLATGAKGSFRLGKKENDQFEKANGISSRYLGLARKVANKLGFFFHARKGNYVVGVKNTEFVSKARQLWEERAPSIDEES